MGGDWKDWQQGRDWQQEKKWNKKAAPAPQGRFANQWQSYQKLPEAVKAAGVKIAVSRAWEQEESAREPLLDPKAEAEESAKRKRQFVAKARYRLSKAIHASNCEESCNAAEDILSCGEELANDLMLRLLMLSCDLPGAERFARALNICGRGGVQINEHDFAAIIGRLMFRDAPQAQVRAALNLGLQKDADTLPLIPIQVDKEEHEKACFVGAENDDSGELSDEPEDAAPRALEASRFSIYTKLNGLYKRSDPHPALLGNDRYVYMKPLGGKNNCLFAYFWQGTAKEGEPEDPNWRTGWYIGSEIGGGGVTYAFLPESTAQWPPAASKWKIQRRDGSWYEEPEYGSFDKPFAKGSKAIIADEEEARKVMETIDLDKLKGSLVGRDVETAKYFAHFFVLLNLEHLAEVFGFRCRWGFRQCWELVSFGLCFNNLEVAEVGQHSDETKKMPLPGWPDTGSQRVTFRIPKGMNPERVQIKKGESVCVSRGDPLRARIAEGAVREMEFKVGRMVVEINGVMPDDPGGKKKYRVDVYANRTTYERQVTALLEFVVQKRSRLCDMLVAAGVGKVDLAVLGGDGFMQDKDKLGGATTSISIANDGKMDEDAICDNLEKIDSKAEKDKKDAAEAEKKKVEEENEWPELAKAPEVVKEPKSAADMEMEAILESAQLLLEDNDDGNDEAKPSEAKKQPDKEAEADAEKPLQLPGETAEEATKRRTMEVADEIADGVDPAKLQDAAIQVANLDQVSETQREAISNSMSKRLTIVQGPPGTGKTHTSVRILAFWAMEMGYKPLLATSECNVAVDNIAAGLVMQGVKVVRVGRPEKVGEVLEKACLDIMVQNDKEKRKEEAGEDDSSDDDGEYWPEPEDRESEEWDQWRAYLTARMARKKKNRQLDQWARARFLEEAQVICCTTISSGSKALSGYKFHGILIDEVAQATETSALVPIVMRGAKQLVLCGDHCQLPPSVQSREAELRGYSLSLYSRLVEAGVPFRFLDTQYRAHPMLMEFSAFSIYQGKLKNGIDGSKRKQPQGIPWPSKECPAAFFECSVEEHLNGESKANEAEARIVCKMIQDCLAFGELTMADIGVVTPYKGQVRTLRTILHEAIPEAKESRKLEIASVDNFQGREKELIIFSAVRCNKFGSVGFLKDWRRLNVMITRARRGLVVVGNAVTLCCDVHWKLWLRFTEKQGGCKKGTVAKAMAELEAMGKGKGKGKGGHDDVLLPGEKPEDLEVPDEDEAEPEDIMKKRKKLAKEARKLMHGDGSEKSCAVKSVEAEADYDEYWCEEPKKKKKKKKEETWADLWEEEPAPAKKKKEGKGNGWAELWEDSGDAGAKKKKKRASLEWTDDQEWWDEGTEGDSTAKAAGASVTGTTKEKRKGAPTEADEWNWADSYGESDDWRPPKAKKTQKDDEQQQKEGEKAVKAVDGSEGVTKEKTDEDGSKTEAKKKQNDDAQQQEEGKKTEKVEAGSEGTKVIKDKHDKDESEATAKKLKKDDAQQQKEEKTSEKAGDASKGGEPTKDKHDEDASRPSAKAEKIQKDDDQEEGKKSGKAEDASEGKEVTKDKNDEDS